MFHTDTRLYTLLMVDLDVPNPESQSFTTYLHWMQYVCLCMVLSVIPNMTLLDLISLCPHPRLRLLSPFKPTPLTFPLIPSATRLTIVMSCWCSRKLLQPNPSTSRSSKSRNGSASTSVRLRPSTASTELAVAARICGARSGMKPSRTYTNSRSVSTFRICTGELY